MRSLGFLGLVVWGGCASDADFWWVADAEAPVFEGQADPAPAPPIALDFSVSTLVQNQVVDLIVSGALPGESIWILRSEVGLGVGPCHPIIDNGCVDIQAPVVPMGPWPADGAGVLVRTPTLPAFVPDDLHVCLQAVAPRGPGGVDSVKSATVCRVVNGGLAEERDGANPGNDHRDNTSMGGPNLLFAMKHVMPADTGVGYLQIYTGEVVGTQSLALWSHDAANDEPDQELLGGSWQTAVDKQWQGTPLANEPVIPAGETVWVVWGPLNGAQASEQDVGVQVTYRGSFDGGATWNGPFTGAWKYKLCGRGGC